MRRLCSTLCGLAVLAFGAVAPLPAQVCAGFAALDDTRFRVAASAESHIYADALGRSLTVGRGVVHGTLSGARLYDEEVDATAYDVGLEVGAGVTDARRRGFLCPVAALSASFGPRNFLLMPGTSEYRVSGALGLGVAAVALRGRHVALHPAAGARLVHLYRRISLPSLHRDDRDSFVLLTGGLGLVIGDRITIRPGFSVPFGIVQDYSAERFAVPFGREEREVSFDVSVGVNFGRRERR